MGTDRPVKSQLKRVFAMFLSIFVAGFLGVFAASSLFPNRDWRYHLTFFLTYGCVYAIAYWAFLRQRRRDPSP